MEMLLGAMVMALLVKAIPAAIVDTFATLRAATAGEWGLIDKERDRKHQRAASRREAVSKAWQATRARRHKKAGGTGQHRPGMAAYLGDVYHGLWEDQLEKRKAKRAARPPVGPDGRRPQPSRLDQAVEGKVARQRSRTGYMGRAARLLIDPVGERRQPADVVPPRSDGRGDAGSAGGPVDPWPVDGDEPTINFAADGPRTACPVCGDTLTSRDGGWDHPQGSTCALGYPLDAEGGPPVPQRVAEQANELYQTNRAEGRTGALGETQTARDLRGMYGDQYPQHVYDQAAADAQYVPDPNAGMRPIGEDTDPPSAPTLSDQQRIRNELYGKCAYRTVRDGFQDEWCDNPFNGTNPYCDTHRTTDAPAGRCVRCNRQKLPQERDQPLCSGCQLELDALHRAATEAVAAHDPDGTGAPDATAAAVAAVKTVDRYGWLPKDVADFVHLAQLQAAEHKTATTAPSSNGGTAMTDNTDLLDYTTAVAEHEQVLAKLREQRAEATAFKQHITGATTAVEHMDGNRGVLATGLSAIAEGMEGSRFGADATSGSAEAAGALSAGSIAAVQEHIEAANDTNDRWITELDASIEGVQASLQHLKSTYGEAAATVQETGVDARALAEH